MNIDSIIVAALLLLLSPAGVQAHGNMRSVHDRFDYAEAEQMPFGIAADPEKAARSIWIEMADTMRFTPSEVEIRRGQAVRFLITNKGRLTHEMVLGTMSELKEHAALMRRFPNMEHSEPHMAHVAPGESAEMGWRFNRVGVFYYGCLEPGHFEAGMIGKVIVK